MMYTGYTMRLGVFDSGIGGEAVATSLRQAFPEADILVVNDHGNVPYGSKTMEQIRELTNAAIQPLLAANCDIIIIACNSATAAAIEYLRDRYPSQSFIGLEPMVKPAATLTKTNVIAVCATPATLASERYQKLLATYASNIKVIEPDCSRWAYMIEHDQIDRAAIEQIVNNSCDAGADVIVLACTHYHWLKELISEIAGGRAVVLEPSEAIARRIEQIYALPNPSATITSDPTLTPASIKKLV